MRFCSPTFQLALFSFVSLGFTTGVSGLQTFDRGNNLEIVLLDGQAPGSNLDWGPDLERHADHATIAMNDSGDILVAYHATRDDEVINGYPILRQVEIAYFEFTEGATRPQDAWELKWQRLLGSIGHTPLAGLYPQDLLKCERPDVVAVGDKFFVVWTRRYDRDFNPLSQNPPPQRDEPAVLECAWVEKSGSVLNIYNDGLSHGKGFPLAANYFIRECAGTPDAVVLKQPAGGDPTVGVVFPKQIDFGDYTGDNTRQFQLGLVTCSIDAQGNLTGSQTTLIRDPLPFHGPTAPPGQDAAGLVLPDLAPSTEENAFWVAYEGQLHSPPDVIGTIRLEYWKLGAAWNMEVAKSFQTSHTASTFIRRRPMVASYPAASTHEDVSISFVLIPPSAPPGDSDVTYQQWRFEGGGLQPVPIPIGTMFPNSPIDIDGKCVPLHGTNSNPYLRRCYFNRSGSGVQYYDLDSNQVFPATSSTTSARAAISFNKTGSANHPSIALCWEDDLFVSGTGTYKRIVVSVE